VYKKNKKQKQKTKNKTKTNKQTKQRHKMNVGTKITTLYVHDPYIHKGTTFRSPITPAIYIN